MLANMPFKGMLAIFLVAIAATMVFVWMICVFILKSTVDAGMAALLASFVTMFIKMAADASGFQYTSSAGSEKKDEVQAKVSEKLADKVPMPPGAAPVIVVAWWSKLVNGEVAAIEAAKADPKVQEFIDAAKIGRAAPEQLTYLVSLKLLTAERAAAIQAI